MKEFAKFEEKLKEQKGPHAIASTVSKGSLDTAESWDRIEACSTGSGQRRRHEEPLLVWSVGEPQIMDEFLKPRNNEKAQNIHPW